MECLTMYDFTKVYRKRSTDHIHYLGMYYNQDQWGFTCYRIGNPEVEKYRHLFAVEVDFIDKCEVARWLDDNQEESNNIMGDFRSYASTEVVELMWNRDFANSSYHLFSHYISAVNFITQNGRYAVVRLE